MKPSFVEKIEEYILKYPKVTNEYKWICEYSSKEIIGIRRERINRLSNFKWQIFYALVFHAICNEVFKDEKFANKNDRLRFYATAYNSGFDKEPDVLKKWVDRETFPYGPKSTLEQYCYSKLSLEFYEQYSFEFK